MKYFMSSSARASTTFSDVFARLECELNQFQSAIQTPKARAAALATVDKDILSILTRRNTLVPISILPAEVLSRIFLFAAFNSSDDTMPKLRSINFTHVCWHWRQVALDNSTLWKNFSDNEHKEWIVERLSRARNAPLAIEFGRPKGEDMLSLFIPHISRTRELYLRYISGTRYSAIMQRIGTQKAPTLKRLELLVSTRPPIQHLAGNSFFNGPLPELRIFCVQQILFPWSLFPRGRLTRLEVSLFEGPEVSPYDDLNQLIDLLVNCPTLEVLTLHDCLPVTVSEFSGRRTVHLPRLSRLCLCGPSSRVTNLFKMLKLSSLTTLDLKCLNAETHHDHLILPVLSAHFNSPTPIEFRSFEITLNDTISTIDMIASTSLPTSPILHAHDTHAELNLLLSFLRTRDRDDAMVTNIRRACEVLPFSKLEFLSICLETPITTRPVDWGEMFRPCTEVTTVQLYDKGTTSLLQALIPPQRSHGTGRERRLGDDGSGTRSSVSAPVLIFPKLTFLLLENLNYKRVVPDSGVLFNLLLGAVKRRKEMEMPLTTLVINNSSLSTEEAGKLEKVVPVFRRGRGRW